MKEEIINAKQRFYSIKISEQASEKLAAGCSSAGLDQSASRRSARAIALGVPQLPSGASFKEQSLITASVHSDRMLYQMIESPLQMGKVKIKLRKKSSHLAAWLLGGTLYFSLSLAEAQLPEKPGFREMPAGAWTAQDNARHQALCNRMGAIDITNRGKVTLSSGVADLAVCMRHSPAASLPHQADGERLAPLSPPESFSKNKENLSRIISPSIKISPPKDLTRYIPLDYHAITYAEFEDFENPSIATVTLGATIPADNCSWSFTGKIPPSTYVNGLLECHTVAPGTIESHLTACYVGGNGGESMCEQASRKLDHTDPCYPLYQEVGAEPLTPSCRIDCYRARERDVLCPMAHSMESYCGDVCYKQAFDLGKLPQPKGNPTNGFLVTQACIAKTSCLEKGQLESSKWLDEVVRDFVTPFVKKRGEWKKVIQRCHARPKYIPMRDLFCQRDMAAYHIRFDLENSLDKNGCGTDKDWEKIGGFVKDCINDHLPFVINWVAKAVVTYYRNQSRANCLAHQ